MELTADKTLTRKQIAEIVGVSVDTVSDARKRCRDAARAHAVAKRNSRQISEAEEDEIWNLSRQGYSPSDVMAITGHAATTIRRALARYSERVRAEGVEALRGEAILSHEGAVAMNTQRRNELYTNPPPKLTPQGVPATRKIRDENGKVVKEEEIADLTAYLGPDEQRRKTLVTLAELLGFNEPKKSVRVNMGVEEIKQQVKKFAEAMQANQLEANAVDAEIVDE